MKWYELKRKEVAFFETKIFNWLGPEFLFPVRKSYWVRMIDPEDVRIYGFGVDFEFGGAEDWTDMYLNSDIPPLFYAQRIESTEFERYTWRSPRGTVMVPDEIASEIKRGKGLMPSPKFMKQREIFFRCEYD